MLFTDVDLINFAPSTLPHRALAFCAPHAQPLLPTWLYAIWVKLVRVRCELDCIHAHLGKNTQALSEKLGL
jgi:hypothetical protein